jgi:hypothetical protein
MAYVAVSRGAQDSRTNDRAQLPIVLRQEVSQQSAHRETDGAELLKVGET